MFLEFPTDTNTYTLSYQFMLGSELLIAPVLSQNETSLTVYLPAGNWVNLWTNEVINSPGRNYTIGNLRDRAAVFYKQGSPVGMEFKQNLTAAGVN
ncbi:MAG: glycoside hydrolase family 31 protein, partial [Chitinophagales bacterium]